MPAAGARRARRRPRRSGDRRGPRAVDSGRQRISGARRDRSRPGARSELAGDACGRLGDRGDEALRRPARHDPLGVADHAHRADRVPAEVEDRRCDARFAEDRLVALARDAALADALELRAQLARNSRALSIRLVSLGSGSAVRSSTTEDGR
jgi:hypothetical protein